MKKEYEPVAGIGILLILTAAAGFFGGIWAAIGVCGGVLLLSAISVK